MASVGAILTPEVSKPIGKTTNFFNKVTYCIKHGRKAKTTHYILIGQGLTGVEEGKTHVVVGIEKEEKKGIFLWCTEVLLIFMILLIYFLRKNWMKKKLNKFLLLLLYKVFLLLLKKIKKRLISRCDFSHSP